MTPISTTKLLPAVTECLCSTLTHADDQRPYQPIRYELNFVTEGVPPCVVEAHRETQWFINDIINRQKSRARWLTLYGCSGAGKTHLATAAARVLREAGHRVQTWRWGRALGMMMDGEWELMPQLCKLPVLVLDDVGAEYLGAERARQLNAAKLLELLEARLNKWTIITTNLRPQQMGEELDPRLASRLYRGQNILVDMGRDNDYALRAYRLRHPKH